jgi:hypothetical protein
MVEATQGDALCAAEPPCTADADALRARQHLAQIGCLAAAVREVDDLHCPARSLHALSHALCAHGDVDDLHVFVDGRRRSARRRLARCSHLGGGDGNRCRWRDVRRQGSRHGNAGVSRVGRLERDGRLERAPVGGSFRPRVGRICEPSPAADKIFDWLFSNSWRFATYDLVTHEYKELTDFGWQSGGYYPARDGNRFFLLTPGAGYKSTTYIELMPDGTPKKGLSMDGWSTRAYRVR